mgnify:CR=1 FL=1
MNRYVLVLAVAVLLGSLGVIVYKVKAKTNKIRFIDMPVLDQTKSGEPTV